jgi:hypothetical protein
MNILVQLSFHPIIAPGCGPASAGFLRAYTEKQHSVRSVCTRSRLWLRSCGFSANVYKKNAFCAFCVHTLPAVAPLPRVFCERVQRNRILCVLFVHAAGCGPAAEGFQRTCTEKPHSARSVCTRCRLWPRCRGFSARVYRETAFCAFCVHTLPAVAPLPRVFCERVQRNRILCVLFVHAAGYGHAAAGFLRACTEKQLSARSVCTRSRRWPRRRWFSARVYRETAFCAFCLHTLPAVAPLPRTAMLP